ncbi:hypothetical protein KUTeg_012865 [Tegillarca granosa]|uniref:Uncharacterized protein n=1 Tax=Tegillarca granosa TaxID=220873 RepID=A0ABQ9EVK0_TEGGR|nr:hypothetical protein KUTeg_012865 [Tegillarca granosa]
MMSKNDMLKFLTQRFKTQTLNDIHQNELDDDRDSGTESDENPDLDDVTDEDWNLKSDKFNDELSPLKGSFGPLMHSIESNATHEISENNLDSISCTSDYERQSLDFDRHSSEDELETIHKEIIQGAEKRKWSQVNTRSCNSAGSSDEEVKELMLQPQPVLFSSSPPKDVQKVSNPTPPPCPPAKIFLKKVTPITLTTVSPRKRHRQTSTSDTQTDSGTTTVIQRPCLDFEKMQSLVISKMYDMMYN